MIKLIKIKDVATCDSAGIEINECKKINFIYGANGSGKTTISNYLADPENECFQNCSLEWVNTLPIQTLVYNKEYKRRNFGESDIPGVFTLGQATDEEIKRIAAMKSELDAITDKIKGKIQTINNQNKENDAKTEDFKEFIWENIFKKNDKKFQEAFTGCRNDKKAFRDRLMKEISNKVALDKSRDELIKNAQVLFGTPPTEMPFLTTILIDDLIEIENDIIWDKIIVGKKDVDVAKIIQKLNIGDWVNEGRKHIQEDGVCPFCQNQTITEKFKAQLDDYFSGEFETDTKKIDSLKKQYDLLQTQFVKDLEVLEESEKVNSNSFLEIFSLTEHINTIKNMFRSNLITIESKIKEPSRSIKLSSVVESFNAVNQLIIMANDKVKENNRLVLHYGVERKTLISNIWALLIDENRSIIDRYSHDSAGRQRGIVELNKQKTELEDSKEELNKKIVNATKNITSVQPSVDEINQTLISFGFQGFKIVPSSIKNCYQIQRLDGSIATESLSEGEISFITFLYFLQRAKGGSTAENVTDNRVLVIDDPISSLDCNVLFIVSSLIKSILNNIRNNEGNIKQVFILTHNVYFHKEASFIDGRTRENRDTYYWILRKNNNITSIHSYDMKNPINTSYGLLWHELKASANTSSVTIQNIMRRIIENYFKILGRYGDDDLIKKFTDQQDQEICRSLLCWINDGSHNIPDDLYVDSHSDSNDRYSSVFKKIFAETGHEEHYNMMMSVE